MSKMERSMKNSAREDSWVGVGVGGFGIFHLSFGSADVGEDKITEVSMYFLT